MTLSEKSASDLLKKSTTAANASPAAIVNAPTFRLRLLVSMDQLSIAAASAGSQNCPSAGVPRRSSQLLHSAFSTSTNSVARA